jgi:hypothetical protein
MTCCDYIKEYLEGKPEGVAGGTIERSVSDLSGHKPSSVARELRGMYSNKGLLQRRYTQRSPHWVVYRLR